MYVTIILFCNLNFYLSILVFSVVKVGGVILISIFSLIIKLYKYYNKSTNKVLKGCCDGEGGGGRREERGGRLYYCLLRAASCKATNFADSLPVALVGRGGGGVKRLEEVCRVLSFIFSHSRLAIDSMLLSFAKFHACT